MESLAQAEKDKQEAAALSNDESSTINSSVIEIEPFIDIQMPFPEDSLVIRPRWDNPVETQMERILLIKSEVKVSPISWGPLSLFICLSTSDESAASLCCN